MEPCTDYLCQCHGLPLHSVGAARKHLKGERALCGKPCRQTFLVGCLRSRDLGLRFIRNTVNWMHEVGLLPKIA